MPSFISRILGLKKQPDAKPGSFPDDDKLSPNLNEKMAKLQPYIDRNRDIKARPFFAKGDPKRKLTLLYMEGRVNQDILYEQLLKSLMLESDEDLIQGGAAEHFVDRLYQTSISIGQVRKSDLFSDTLQSLFEGYVILLIDRVKEALIFDIRGGEHRSPEEPPIERTLRGSREGFVEDIIVNISLIRKRLSDPNLVIEKSTIGRRTRTDIAILYIDDIADPELVANIKDKIKQIDVDGIAAIGYIEQFIEDNPRSIFPQLRSTERPDKLVTELLEGKVAIVANGTPWVLIAPSQFINFMQASEDYYERIIVANFTRLFRFFAFFLAISLPGLYISLLSFHQELVPFQLFLTLAQARQNVPFPVALEVIIQEVIIQLVVEMGLRLPTTIGQTVGVVAGIVLGQAAISANLASPGIIIIIVITTICTFSMPNYSMVLAVRVLRLFMIGLTSAFGLFGFSIGWFLILVHLASLESFGVPYFAPFAPTRYSEIKDSLIRAPLKTMNRRPASIPHQDDIRQGRIK
jgi:spore germination protein KA